METGFLKKSLKVHSHVINNFNTSCMATNVYLFMIGVKINVMLSLFRICPNVLPALSQYPPPANWIQEVFWGGGGKVVSPIDLSAQQPCEVDPAESAPLSRGHPESFITGGGLNPDPPQVSLPKDRPGGGLDEGNFSTPH